MSSTNADAKRWVADRMRRIHPSGVRRVSELASGLSNPINLSIGQPHFDVPETIKLAAKEAIDAGRNAYTSTAGVNELREKIRCTLRKQYPNADRDVLITAGSTGGIVLALCASVDPGDEVILFDPCFLMYPPLVELAGGKVIPVDTYPDFAIDLAKVEAAITPRTKAILFNNPANPTGMLYSPKTVKNLALLARDRGVFLICDEVYRAFCYDALFSSPAEFNENALVVDSFSKAYSMTGWRIGLAHGPKPIIEEMTKLQHYTFVCAPSIAQHASLAALDFDVSGIVADYRAKRDLLYEGIRHRFEVVKPEGAFYMFPKVPHGTAEEFTARAIRSNLLIVPGSTFSSRDSHVRLSYAAPKETVERGIEVLNRLAAE